MSPSPMLQSSIFCLAGSKLSGPPCNRAFRQFPASIMSMFVKIAPSFTRPFPAACSRSIIRLNHLIAASLRCRPFSPNQCTNAPSKAAASAEKLPWPNSPSLPKNENARHPDSAVAGEAPLERPWIRQITLCDPLFVGEIPHFAWDDRVVCLAATTKAAIARGHFVLAMCSRSKRETASRYPDRRSEISNLDFVTKHFDGVDRCHAPI